MRHFFAFFVVLMFINRPDSTAGQAQLISTTGVIINGNMANGIGTDRTMAGASITNVVSSYAMKYYTDSVTNNTMIALTDTAIVFRALFPGIARASITLTTTGTGVATYVSGNLNIPTPYIQTTYAVTRAINSSTFTISSLASDAVYYIKIQCTATIGSTASGTVELQYSINSGTTWIPYGQAFNSNTVSLAVVLNSVSASVTPIFARNIPPGALCRLVSTVTGTTTNSYIYGFETY